MPNVSFFGLTLLLW